MDYKEIEYKYWANSFTKEELFSRIEEVVLENESLETPETIYVVSCDDYYIRNADEGQNFVRFRKGGGIYELTLKRKLKTNVIRKEINLNVTNNEDSAVVEFLTLSGYEKAFQVYKEAWIWHFDNCDVSYYTLSDGRSVVELEALNYSSLEEGVKSINDWEESLGLSELSRETRSLYEIFTEEGASIVNKDGDKKDAE
jgi:adenylate cyclase class IV